VKRILLITTVLTTSIYSFAQHNNEFFNDGALVHVQAGAEVHVWGDVHNVQATGDLQNNGLIKVQGNSYSDNLFQQSGTGVYLVENSNVNIGERQFIEGSYAVRGGQALTGVNDGSFYDLELSNDQGIVYLVGGGNVADVRNSVDYSVGAVKNRILTHDVGMVGAVVPPANGSLYSGVFGIMNPASGMGGMIDNTVLTGGNMSGVDNGYVQGKLRRAIAAGGGAYEFVLGLEPAGAGAQRGMQYTRADIGANNYDVIESYFETGSPNLFASMIECSGAWLNYFGGVDHGEWMLQDITGAGVGAYEMWIWPQDDNYPLGIIWALSKDNALTGTANQCGPTPIGLSRGGFNGFATPSEFDAVSAIIILPIELIDINATGVIDHIDVTWTVGSESNLSHYELERSEDGVDFNYITSIDGVGTTSQTQYYDYSDYNIRYFQDFYYRVKTVDMDGNYEYTPIVVANLKNANGGFNEGVVSIYPNPSSEDFNISIYSDEERDLSMRVYNSVGQVIQERTSSIKEGNTVMNIASSEWASGVYHIALLDLVSGQTINKKFIKK